MNGTNFQDPAETVITVKPDPALRTVERQLPHVFLFARIRESETQQPLTQKL